ncbi:MULTISPECIES: RluA family pseudouridine synthase [Alteromonadaceae]|uniref:RluA family pseudouridine synthase n=1 Tax=Alteromonadaceae TaxID=72275 RepID=UPI001C0913F4|nr:MULTISPECIES: RluA family pseudouridine synthase [unclassified Aliiglaciecola]MBU2877093.1 RluA family pseudouridine synthase [Aliiglaciecola lipolytica]MDO6710188.1 RluA family pseudouridine synthase [Aliiglaciecola sp. 2_MG-2023]MDO6751336.1 RluA family pseudouridine synthase [Aliiglaciecola sp. 1_MG-2023]
MNNIIVDTFVAPKCLEKINILYQDASILLINKPSGLLSLSGKNPLNYDSVHFRLVQEFSWATMVHRLDLGTSGIMVVALNKQANSHLAKQFQMRTVQKSYISLLQGHLNQNTGQISQPIAKDPNLFPKVKICSIHGKEAVTNYSVLERLNSPYATRVRYRPQTGRTHQLRIHSEYLAHPILGCDLYGTCDSYKAANRLMLHAESIEFEHPTTGKKVQGICPAPF